MVLGQSGGGVKTPVRASPSRLLRQLGTLRIKDALQCGWPACDVLHELLWRRRPFPYAGHRLAHVVCFGEAVLLIIIPWGSPSLR